MVDAFGIVVPALATDEEAGHVTRDVSEARKELERDLYAVLPTPSPPKAVPEAS